MEHFEAGFEHIVLELCDLEVIDWNGLSVVVTQSRLADAHGLTLSLVNGPPGVRRVLDVCGLIDQLRFAE